MSTINIINIQHYSSPCGELLLGSFEGKLCLCDWAGRKSRERIDNRMFRLLNATYEEQTTSVIEEAKKQLDEYFRGERREFELPLLLVGTEFQKQVWKRLQEVPYGETTTYAQLAQAMGMPKAVRAVANANGANALSIFVPCHRVVGSDQSLTGYAGGLETKRFLLTLENKMYQNIEDL